MLVRKGNHFELYPHKVKYTQHGETIEQWALPNKQWWIDFADKWEHTTIIEFTEVHLTQEQLSRFEDVKTGIPESYASSCIDYILDGSFPEGITHPLRELQIYNQQVEQDEILLENTVELIELKWGV